MEKSIMSLLRCFLPLSLLAFTVTSCADSNDEPFSGKKDSVSRSIKISDLERQASIQSNIFAWNLLEKSMAYEDKDRNVVLSPLSANICLSMLANGASGESRQQILQVLGCSEGDIKDLNSLNKKIAHQICDLDDNVSLSIANSFWYSDAIKPKSVFLADLKDNYGIESYSINPKTFSSDVNRWCNDKTKGLIPRILDDGSLEDFAFLNAIYFKGLWNSEYRFDKELTVRDEFYNWDGTKTWVSYMRQRKRFQYHCDELWSALLIPFGGGGFNLTVILPNEDTSVDECMSSIKDFEPISGKFFNEELDVKLPKLSIKHNQELIPVLKLMGISDIFVPSLADFSNMTDHEMVVDMAKQNVSFELDENGAEAAAVTIIGGIATALPSEPSNFYVTHPFVFMISEKSTGAILFMGRINKL